MFNKFFKFLKGYVIIKICGNESERFINICVRRGINIGRVKRLSDGALETAVPKSGFFLLRPIAYKTHTKVRILKKVGLYNAKKRYGRRYALIFGIILAAAFVYISSQFIWTVEINGVELSDYNSVCAALEKSGVYAGARKKDIADGEEIKSNIVSENENIVWAWAYIEGAKARVEVFEKIIPPKVINRDEPCDVVAACDGYIKKAIVKNGQKLCREGDTVSAGDVLISGTVPVFKEGEEERYISVHASGTVEAETEHKASGMYGVYYESKQYTGKHKRIIRLELFGKSFKLFGSEKNMYKTCDRAEKRHELKLPFIGYTGISVDNIVYDEYETHREPISIETAAEFAKNELEEKIAKELLYDSRLIDEEFNYVYTDSETIKEELTMKFIEKIGTQQPIRSEKTD